MNNYRVYEFGSVPLKESGSFIDGEKYVTSDGDILEWKEKIQDFEFILESPLDLTLEDNTVENLTDVQLNLFWRLCK